VAYESGRRGDAGLDWIFGGEFERSVGETLQSLPDDWLVLHNLKKDYGGNVDYVASCAIGTYAIEAKSGHYAGRYAGQAEANARFVKYKLQRTNVVPVLCVGDPWKPVKKGNVWVMSAEHLAPWLIAQQPV